MCYCVTVFSVPSLLSPPVVAELHRAILVTSEECKELMYSSRVVRTQRGKSPEVQIETAAILARNGFVDESNFLAGKQRQPWTCLSKV